MKRDKNERIIRITLAVILLAAAVLVLMGAGRVC